MKFCLMCGRSSCRCGQAVTNRACSRHGATLTIVSIASVGTKKTIWTEAAKCSVHGCKTVRNFDKDRRPPTFGASPFILKLQKKFGAQIRAGFYRDEKQDCRPRTSHGLESGPEVQKRRTRRDG